MNNSLYQITESLKGIETALIENEGEITQEIETALEVLSSELQLKTDGVTEYIKSLEATQALAKQRAKEFKDLENKIKSKLEKFNEYVVLCMDKLQVTELKGEYSKVSIRKPSQVVEIVDEKELPVEFIKVEKVYKIDKAGIKDALKRNEDVNGARLAFGARKATFKI